LLAAIPAALVRLGQAGGLRRALPAGWVGLVCAAPALLTVALKAGPMTGRLQEGETFYVDLPGAEVGVPSAAEPSVRIECRCRSLRSRFEQLWLSGEVLAVRLGPAAPAAWRAFPARGSS
jgi:flavin reductase (DIM6/NTAB) family NADH-FMN oxidoreductase RutF